MALCRNGTRRCRECQRCRQERFFTPKGWTCSTCKSKKRRNTAHDKRVQDKYGLNPGEYDVLFKAQGGACAICRGRRRQRLSVDHDHKTGMVRGLLCRMCNGRLLPSARDSVQTLQSAVAYLESPPAQKALGKRFYQGEK